MRIFKPIRVTALMGIAAAFAAAPYQGANAAEVKVASTSKVIFDNLALFVARDGGFFKKHGLNVEISHFRGGGEVVRAVSGGSMQIGMVATTAAIIAAGRGEPVRIISGWTAPSYGIAWIVPTDSPIKSIQDLAGKKAGVSRPGSVTHTGLVAALQATDLKDKVGIVPVGGPGDSWGALKNGRVQASWHTAPYMYSLINKGEARILFDISTYLKEYQQGSLIATADWLDGNGETVSKFLKASAEAMEMIAAKPEEAAKIGAAATKMSQKMVLQTIQNMPKGFFGIGAPEASNFKGSMDEALGTGALKQPLDYDKMVVKKYLP